MSDDKSNGHDKDDHDKDEQPNVIRLPSLAERQKRARQEQREEQRQETHGAAWRAQNAQRAAGNDVPFFNAGRIPPLTKIMLAALIAVQAIMSFALTDAQRIEAFFTFGFVPADYTNGALTLSALLGPFTYMLLHGGWMHLIFNGVMILAIGSFAEKTFGMKRMAIIVIGSSLGGALLHFALNTGAATPVIGASGAVSGLFAMALMILYAQGRMGPISDKGPLPVIALWAGLLVVMGMLSGSNVAWQAHLGGFFAGLMILRWFKARDLRFWRL